MTKCPTCGRENKSRRSNPQSRYFHGVVLRMLSDHTGYSCEELKDILKSKFLRDDYILETKNGIVVEKNVVLGSSEVDTKRFEQFMTDIRQWASQELGVYLPLPNETPEE